MKTEAWGIFKTKKVTAKFIDEHYGVSSPMNQSTIATRRPGVPFKRSPTRERIRAYVKDNPSATVRQICVALECSSTGNVHKLLQQVRAELHTCPTCNGRGAIRKIED